MKRIIFVTLFYSFFVLLTVSSVLAVTSEATSPGKSLKENRLNLATKEGERREQVKELRERLATRVAELREKMRKAFHGEIKSISGKTIILTSPQGDKTILTDEETSFFRTGVLGRKKISLSDLVLGEKITVFGQLNQDTGQLTAKVILAKVLPININGKVAAVDIEGGTITVQTLKRGSLIVDVEVTTKILAFVKGEGLKPSGLSKIKAGDRVHVIGFTPKKPAEAEKRITAKRILIIPGRALGILGSPTPTATASPQTSP